MSWSEVSLAAWQQRLIGMLAAASGVAILASASIVTQRSLAGRFENSLDGRPLLGVAIAGAGLLLAFETGCPRRWGAARWAVRLGLVWQVAILASLCPPAAAAWTAVGITAAVVTVLLIRSAGLRAGSEPPSPLPRWQAVGCPPAALPDALPEERPAWTAASGLVQWSERRATGNAPDGSEVVRGRLAIRFPAGCRIASGHVGFCPPLAHSPRVDLFAGRDDLEASIVATEVRPWGMRIECRLEAPVGESIDLPVDWQATAAR
jgi:hypothetical protein